MPITPYPGRNRSSSKERGGASQGGKTYRMLQGSFGSKPWSRAWAAAVAWSAAVAAAGMREMKLRRILLLHCMVRIIPSLERDQRHIYWMMMRQRMGLRIMNMWMKVEKDWRKKTKEA